MLLLLIVCISLCACSPIQYTAAVVEYAPIAPKLQLYSREDASELMIRNLDNYDKITSEAKTRGAQIILFPEDGLYTPILSSRDFQLPFLERISEPGSNPCTEVQNFDSKISQRVSCMARIHQIILVVNMGEVVYCSKITDSKCPDDGRYQYNTLVAFDMDGSILQKYHKSHLYYERQFDAGDGEPKTFKSWFGVEFGLMICFDIQFQSPSRFILKKGTTDFLFSSWWVNMPPINYAVQNFQGFSYEHNINLLASNSGFTGRNSGSGIFSSGKILTSFYNPTKGPVTTLLISNVTTNPKQDLTSDKLFLENVKRVEHNPPMTSFSAFVPTSNSVHNFIQIAGDFKCEISCVIDRAGDGEVYASFASSGFGLKIFPQNICGVYKCGDDVKSCERILHNLIDVYPTVPRTTFKDISIMLSGDVQNSSVFPIVSGPLGSIYIDDLKTSAEWNKDGTKYHLNVKGREDKPIHAAVLFNVWK
ncbi:biotinidase [Acrasis kona]|uniref:Biotinidase n=1 Tax=Acrasis kona TaxID=1008807 RepID=A0AAW2ZK96_9EUKA